MQTVSVQTSRQTADDILDYYIYKTNKKNMVQKNCVTGIT